MNISKFLIKSSLIKEEWHLDPLERLDGVPNGVDDVDTGRFANQRGFANSGFNVASHDSGGSLGRVDTEGQQGNASGRGRHLVPVLQEGVQACSQNGAGRFDRFHDSGSVLRGCKNIYDRMVR